MKRTHTHTNNDAILVMSTPCLVVIAALLVLSTPTAQAEGVPYTLEDRDRLIRIETSLQEFKASVDKRFEQVDKRMEEFQRNVDKRFEQVDKRFDQMMGFMGILASVFGGLVAVTIGFAVWDRRTALAPAVRRSGELAEREERIEQALREMAQKDPNVAEALRHAGLL
jgi:hypothetical protein